MSSNTMLSRAKRAVEPRVRVMPLSLWHYIDFPNWTWCFEVTREFMRDVGEGEALPPWYGVAWWDYNRDVAVCMVVPLNVVAGAVRAAWVWLRFPPWRRANFRAQMERALRRANQERDRAWGLGFTAGYRQDCNDEVQLGLTRAALRVQL